MQGHAVSIHGDDVEADAGVWCNDLHVIGCEPAKRGPFTCVYRSQRPAEAPRRSHFDLYENDGIAVAAKQIDLAARQAKIPPDDPVSGSFEKQRGPLLARAPFFAVTRLQRRRPVRSPRRAVPPAPGTSRSGGAARVRVL